MIADHSSTLIYQRQSRLRKENPMRRTVHVTKSVSL